MPQLSNTEVITIIGVCVALAAAIAEIFNLPRHKLPACLAVTIAAVASLVVLFSYTLHPTGQAPSFPNTAIPYQQAPIDAPSPDHSNAANPRLETSHIDRAAADLDKMIIRRSQPGRNLVAVQIDARTTVNGYSPESKLISLLKNGPLRAIQLFNQKTFKEQGFFDDIYNGNAAALIASQAMKQVNHVMLGKLIYDYQKGAVMDDNLISCRATLTYRVIYKDGNNSHINSVNVTGAGFSEDAALERAIEMLAEHYSNQILNPS